MIDSNLQITTGFGEVWLVLNRFSDQSIFSHVKHIENLISSPFNCPNQFTIQLPNGRTNHQIWSCNNVQEFLLSLDQNSHFIWKSEVIIFHVITWPFYLNN